ncbi:hypothetical protein ACFQ1S_43430, partial [Kibdelosporangium lantanae]
MFFRSTWAQPNRACQVDPPTASPNDGGPRVIGEDWGDKTITVTTTDEVSSSYSVGGGSITLDMSALKSGSVHTDVNVGLGDATVIVPADAAVNIDCQASRGSVDCLGNEYNGIPAKAHASGAQIVLAIEGGSQAAANYIMATDETVIGMGGFGGGDPAPSVTQLATWVREGRLRFVLEGA